MCLNGIEPVVLKRSDGREVWYVAIVTPYRNDEIARVGQASEGTEKGAEPMSKAEAEERARALAVDEKTMSPDLPILPIRHCLAMEEVFRREWRPE